MNRALQTCSIFCLTAILTAAIATLTQLFSRAELQSINHRFETRPWILWKPEALSRLDPDKLWQYHESHEIPRRWWAWDYTLSWLIEPNHPNISEKIVIFNHLLEDEPPPEALQTHPWLKPLMSHPLPRKTYADMIELIARCGAKSIIIDNDFPQFMDGDAQLAAAISACSSGKLTGKPVPVFLASTVNHRSQQNLLQLDVGTRPDGILRELEQLSPGTNVEEKFTGTTTVILDEDQVVRRIPTKLPSADGSVRRSVVVKVLNNPDVPDVIDIDFAAPPNSGLFPIRPWNYLLDPEHRNNLLNPSHNSSDVSLNGATVIIGDGVIDGHITPLTNHGVNLMSGSELLANAIDTVARRSWLTRVDGVWGYLYALMVFAAATVILFAWKRRNPASETATSIWQGLLKDLAVYLAIVFASILAAHLAFSALGLIVPLVVPGISLVVAALVSAIWENERQRSDVLQQRLQSAHEKLDLERARYEAELKLQAAQAREQEVIQDQNRRKEFVRRINHDLKAPVTVLNWTLSKLQQDELKANNANEKIDRLSKTSDRLFQLIDELVRTYDYDASDKSKELPLVDLTQIARDCVTLNTSLADIVGSKLDFSGSSTAYVYADPLSLARVVDNLIRNALNHNQSGTHVRVEVRSRATAHQLVVSDTGKGIDAEILPHIFEAGFSTGDSTGLGLSIVQALIEDAGGKVTVETGVELGTTFLVTLPAATEIIDSEVAIHSGDTVGISGGREND